MINSRGRSRSVSKLTENLLTIPLTQLTCIAQAPQHLQKSIFPLIRHIAASQSLQKRDKGPAPKPKSELSTPQKQPKLAPASELPEDSRSIFKIMRHNKSLKSIKIKRKRTYYWKLFELASLYMVSPFLIAKLKRYTEYSDEDISIHFITSKTSDQVKQKLTANKNFSQNEKFYSEKLNRFQPKIAQIYSKVKTGEVLNDQSPAALAVIESIAKYLQSIKQNVIRLIKKTSLKDPEKPLTDEEKQHSCYKRREDTSTKMTEDDRISGNNIFVSDGKPKKSEKNLKKDLCIFELKEKLELPRPRSRSSSFHLGKRRFENLCKNELNCEKILKVEEFGILGVEKEEREEGVGSSFFMMTNQFYKSRDAGVRVNL
jgi:hypothetical protein